MRRLVSFLGTGNYQNTIYRFPGGESKEGDLFAVLAAEVYGADTIDCLATEEAWSKYGEKLTGLAEKAKIPIERRDVPAAKNDDDLWRIFDCVVKLVEVGDELILDFTHGLRSMPLIGVAAASVAALVKNAQPVALLYGAFDQRQQETDGGVEVTPVIDLMPFYTLLKWQAGCEEFARSGLAVGLGKALRAHGQAPGAVESFLRHAKDLELALVMTDPCAVQASAKELSKAAAKVGAAPTGPKIPPVPPPMQVVAEWVSDACSSFVANEVQTP